MNKINIRLHTSDDYVLAESNWIHSKQKILKNLFVIGLAWFFLFTAFQAMANLQSSLNSDEGLGTASLSTIYITLVVSCLFLPPIMIENLGLKWTIVASQFTYLLFIAANIYPKWYFLIPSAVLLGIGAGPLWTAKCTYLTEIAGFYSLISGELNEIVVNRFFGIFFSMFQLSQIIGNLISTTVLKPEIDENERLITKLEYCGANDCPGDLQAKIKRPQLSTVYRLCAIYLCLAFTSILLIVTLLNTYKKRDHSSIINISTNNISSAKKKNRFDLLISTISQLKNGYQLLMIPLTLWLGFSLAFIGADFTKSFVACSKGVDKVGSMMICFGVTDAIGSYVFGHLVKFLGRMPCFLVGAFLNYLMIILMLNWKVNPEQDYILYLIPALWGVADAAWQTQVNSIYGVLFQSNQEAAFSNFRLWESLGFFFSYAYSNYFCTNVKLYLLLIYLTIGILGYLAIEINENQKNPKNNILINYLRNSNFKAVLLIIFLIVSCFYFVSYV